MTRMELSDCKTEAEIDAWFEAEASLKSARVISLRPVEPALPPDELANNDAMPDPLDRPLGQFVRPFVWRDPASLPPRQWVYGRHLIRKFVSATFAPGGVGKSALVLAEAMAMASGKPVLGIRPRKRLRVGYWNGEDPFEETERRAFAASILHGLDADDLEELRDPLG